MGGSDGSRLGGEADDLIDAGRSDGTRPARAGSVFLNSGDSLLYESTQPESDGLSHDSHGLGNLLIGLTRGGQHDNLCALNQPCS